MFSSPFHSCVHCISRITDPSSCLHTCTVWRHEMYIGIDSHLIDLSLCCIICSQIKKITVLVAKPELLISCHPNERQYAVCSPVDPVAWESPKWADNLAGRGVDREWLSALMKNRGIGGICKIRAVWKVCYNDHLNVWVKALDCTNMNSLITFRR